MPSLCNSKKKFVFDLLTRQYDMLKDKTEHLKELPQFGITSSI